MNIGPGVSLKQLNEEVQERIQWHREMELSDTAAKAKIGLLVGAGVTITGAIGYCPRGARRSGCSGHGEERPVELRRLCNGGRDRRRQSG